MKHGVHAHEWPTVPKSEHGSGVVGALLRERDEYLERGLPDRVRQVDEQLAFHGYVPEEE